MMGCPLLRRWLAWWLLAAGSAAAPRQACGCAVRAANASRLLENPACPDRFRGHAAIDPRGAELTVAYLYYRDAAYAEQHVAAWNAFDAALLRRIVFVVVDDGSPAGDSAEAAISRLAPLGRVVVVRIFEDAAWNVGGARNLAFHVAPTEVVLVVDADQMLSAALLSWVLDHAPAEGCDVLRGFPRVLSDGRAFRRVHPGVICASRSTYWTTGGCDEDFVGAYGYTDAHLNRRVETAAGCALVAADAAPPLVQIGDVEKTHYFSRDTSRNKALLDAKTAEGGVWSGDYLRFSWATAYDSARRRPPEPRVV